MQRLQRLTDKQRRLRQLTGLLLGYGKHFLGQIHARDPKAFPGQQKCHRAGATGQVHRSFRPQPFPGQDLLIKRHRLPVVHIVGQPVIAGSKGMIRVH